MQLATEAQSLRDEILEFKARENRNAEALSAADAQVERLRNEKSQILAAVEALQTSNQELEARVKMQSAEAEREAQLNDAAKDIRQLMGARNLHIIDVHDRVSPDEHDKTFGRIFYVEGKSLIFYAFDLGGKIHSSKLVFQAWGHQEGEDFHVRNLGVFRIDQEEQSRWVLRVNNAELLSKIDTVYVTTEPVPGTNKPSGTKLLVAYLGGQPNHP